MAVHALMGDIETVTPQTITVRYYLRIPVPVSLRPAYVNANATSIWPSASNAILNALRNGLIVERSGLVTVPNQGTMEDKRNTVRAAIATAAKAFKAELQTKVVTIQTGDTYDVETDTWTAAT